MFERIENARSKSATFENENVEREHEPRERSYIYIKRKKIESCHLIAVAGMHHRAESNVPRTIIRDGRGIGILTQREIRVNE